MMHAWDKPSIRVGISSCLLGEKVRFDGGHQLDILITEMLGRWFEWVPVCPRWRSASAPREKACACWKEPIIPAWWRPSQGALNAGDKAELVTAIESCRQGLFTLVAPLTLLGHHLDRHPVPWVMEQTHLNPYPAELMLRTLI